MLVPGFSSRPEAHAASTATGLDPELQLRGRYFGIDLTDMSEWLARKQINPSRFTYSTDRIGDSVRVRVDFVSHGEADLFSARFRGRIIA
jgi:hypothetical protein